MRQFQDDFAQALLDRDCTAATGLAGLIAQPSFAVYRNTVMKGCIDALQASFPAVERLVGEEWLRAAAARFVRASPPRQPALIEYGAEFVDFLRDFEPAADLPYLADVARLDRLWTEAHIATDADALGPECVAALSPEQIATACLRPHPAARWALLPTPALTIWQRNREQRDLEAELDWVPEAALLTRPHGAVIATRIDGALCALLDACAAEDSLAGAAQAALDQDPQTDLAEGLTRLLNAGAFCALSVRDLSPRAPSLRTPSPERHP